MWLLFTVLVECSCERTDKPANWREAMIVELSDQVVGKPSSAVSRKSSLSIIMYDPLEVCGVVCICRDPAFCPYVLIFFSFCCVFRVALFNTFSYQLMSLWWHRRSWSFPKKRCSLSFAHSVALLLTQTKHFLLLLIFKAFYLWNTSWLLFRSKS